MISDPVPGAAAVRFDEAAARRLINALEELAASLSSLVRGEIDRAAAVRRDWHGHSRRWFDQRHEDFLSSVQRAITACHDDATEVHRSIGRAAALQDFFNQQALDEAARLAELAELAQTG